jgi:predicted signal transduction protein with EAL and GGDEF domain
MGRDEFIVLLEEIHSLRDATQAAGRWRGVQASRCRSRGATLFVTLSTGIALGPGSYQRPRRPAARRRHGDVPRQGGRAGRFEIFDEEMLARAQEQLRLETDLHQAPARGQFHVVFQPIFELDGGACAASRRSLRWHTRSAGHPAGAVSSRSPRRSASSCRSADDAARGVPTLRRWHELDRAWRDLTLATNLSLRQIYNPGLEERSARSCRRPASSRRASTSRSPRTPSSSTPSR